MSNPLIDKIIDGDAAYAYAYMTNSNGYGHMYLDIRLAKPEYGPRTNAMIRASCQIGSSDGYAPQHEQVYAKKFGFRCTDDNYSLEELEAGVKVMRKVRKSMSKSEEQFGHADTFAEICQRVLLASGARALIVEPRLGFACGGYMRDKDLVSVGAASAKRFKDMEENLIAAFSRKAA
jgi:hypothetical protein